jgi:alpha-L-fucosidase
VKSVDQLVELYFTSVGRNSKLLLNVPPTPDGLFHDVDVERLMGMRRGLDALFATNQVADFDSAGVHRGRTTVYDFSLKGNVPVSILDVREDIRRGQVVSKYVIEGSSDGSWSELARGTTIGYRRLHRIPQTTVSRIRLTVEDALAEPMGLELLAWRG